MREIKFRAWDGVMMVFHADLKSIAQSEAAKNYDWDNLKIMQYTGLKDKNENEIAIGDIIQDKDLEEEPCLVEEGDGMIIAGGGWVNSFRASLVEVIGNIYENPELLTPQP